MNKLYVTIIFTISWIILFIGIPFAFSKPTLTEICRDYDIECKIIYTKKGSPNAYVIGSNPTFYVTGNLQEQLSKEELKVILLHELGHLVLKHHERYLEEVDTIGMNKQSYCSIKRQFEYEADIFSTYISTKYNFGVTLADVFQEFIDKGKIKDTDSCTHPAPSKRIEYIRQAEKMFEK